MNNYPYFDSHAHISSMENPDAIITRAEEKGTFGVLNVCTEEASLEQGLCLAAQYPHFYNAAATVPTDVVTAKKDFVDLVRKAAVKKQLVAIGETGLDYYYHKDSQELQKYFLRTYLHLAWELSLPLIFHCREAFADLFAFCDAEYGKKGGFPAVLHCFTGTKKQAEQVLERGWFISCSGIVTYKKATSLAQIIRDVPLERLLVETDCPYLAPRTVRGKTNEPCYLKETIEKIAQIKEMPVEKLSTCLVENAVQLFSLDQEALLYKTE